MTCFGDGTGSSLCLELVNFSSIPQKFLCRRLLKESFVNFRTVPSKAPIEAMRIIVFGVHHNGDCCNGLCLSASIPAMHVSNSSGSGYYLIGVFTLGGMSSDEDCHARGGRSFPHATVKRRQRHAFL